MTKFTDLIKVLNEEFDPEQYSAPKLITPNSRSSGWLKDRIRYQQQLLITALICSASKMESRLRNLERNIALEFNGVAPIRFLPYPYSDTNLMKSHISELIEKYNAKFNTDDAVEEITLERGESETIEGYLALTIISLPIII